MIAGKRNANVAAAILSNFDTAESALRSSLDSMGSAAKEHAFWLDSIEAKQAQFKAQFEALSVTVMGSSLIKGVYDAGSGILGFLNNVIENLGAIPAFAAAAGAALSFKNIGIFKTFNGTTLKEQFGWGSRSIADVGYDIRAESGFWRKAAAFLTTPTQKAVDFGDELNGFTKYFNDFSKAADEGGKKVGEFFENLNVNRYTRNFFEDLKFINGELQYNGEVVEDAGHAYSMYLETLKKSGQAQSFVSRLKGVLAGLGKGLLNMGVNLGVGLLVQVISNAITKAKQLRDAAYEAAEALEGELKSIDDYANSVESIYEKLSQRNISEQQAYELRSDLLDVQNELIDKYGAELGAVNLVNASYEERLKIFDELKKAELEGWERENRAAIKDAEEFFQKYESHQISAETEGAYAFTGSVYNPNQENIYNPLQEALDVLGFSLQDFGIKNIFVKPSKEIENSTGILKSFIAIEGTVLERVKNLEALYEALSSLPPSPDIENILDAISKEINKLKTDDYTRYTGILEQYAQYQLVAKYNSEYQALLDAQDALYDAIASDDTEKVQSAMQKYEDAFKTANEKIASDADASLFVQKWLEDFNAQMTSQTKDYTLQIDLEANTDNLDKRVKLAVSEFNKLGAIDDVMIKAAIDGDPASGLKKYADALNLVAESYGYTYDEFVNVLTRFGYIQGKQETIAKNAVSLEKALEPVTAAKEQLAAAEKDFQESGTSGFTDDFLASLTKDATAELSKLILQYKQGAAEAKDILDYLNRALEGSVEDYNEAVSQIMGIPVEKVEQFYNVDTVRLDLATQALRSQVEAWNDTVTSGNGLVEAIQTINEGNSLSFSTINSLCLKYPELISQIKKTSDGYTISTNVLKNLHKAEVDEARAAVEAQIVKAKNVIISTNKITEAYKRQVMGISNLMEAEAAYAGYQNQLIEIGGQGLSVYASDLALKDGDLFYKNINLTKDASDELRQAIMANYYAATSTNSAYGAGLAALQEIIKAYAMLEDFTWSPDSVYVNSGSGDDTAKKLDEQFSKVYEALKRQKDRLENAMPDVYEALLSKYGAANGLDSVEQYFDALEMIVRDFYANDAAKAHQYLLEILNGRNDIVQDWISDKEHEIYLLEQAQSAAQRLISAGADDEYARKNAQDNANQRIAILKEMQKKAHDLAQSARARGLDENSEFLQNLQKQWWDFQSEINSITDDIFSTWRDAQKDAVDYQKDALDQIIDLTVELIKKETEDIVDGLEDQIDQYSRIIELKKESLRLSQREKEHNEKVAEINKSLSDMQSRLAALELDDSREAQLQRNQLLDEMSEKQKELSDLQYDYSVTNQEEALDKELDNYTEARQKEIDRLNKYLSNSKKLIADAMARIQADVTTNSNTLYQSLLSWNEQYGDSLEVEICDWWKEAIRLAQEYGSVASAAQQLGDKQYTYEEKPSYSGSTYTAKEQAAIQRMYANSIRWKEASAADRAALQAANAAIAAEFGWTLDTRTGKWFDKHGRWIYENLPKYHTGGVAGGNGTLKQNELLAVLEKREIVLDEAKQKRLFELITGMASVEHAWPGIDKRMIQSLGRDKKATPPISITAPLTVHGNLDDSMKAFIKQYPRFIANEVAKVLL